MHQKINIFFVLTLCLVTFSSNLSAKVIFSDDFGTGGNIHAVTNIGANWNVTSGNVDIWNFFSSQGRSIDLDGTAANGIIETATTFILDPGILYELSFSYGNNAKSNNELNFSVGSILNETLPQSESGTPAYTTITRQFSVTSTTSAKLSFAEQGTADSSGSIIDNIMLQEIGATNIPEPATLALMLFGLAGLASRKKK